MPEHNWLAICPRCGRIDEKRNMKKIYTSVGVYCPTPKILCHLCYPCFAALCDEWEIEEP